MSRGHVIYPFNEKKYRISTMFNLDIMYGQPLPFHLPCSTLSKKIPAPVVEGGLKSDTLYRARARVS